LLLFFIGFRQELRRRGRGEGEGMLEARDRGGRGEGEGREEGEDDGREREEEGGVPRIEKKVSLWMESFIIAPLALALLFQEGSQVTFVP
jgi:hypothetical protein